MRIFHLSLCKWLYDKQLLALACAGPQDSSRFQWMWHWCLPGYWDLSASSIDPNVLYCTWLDFQMKNYQLCTILDLFWSSCEKCNFRCQKLLIFTHKPNTVIALLHTVYKNLCLMFGNWILYIQYMHKWSECWCGITCLDIILRKFHLLQTRLQHTILYTMINLIQHLFSITACSCCEWNDILASQLCLFLPVHISL